MPGGGVQLQVAQHRPAQRIRQEQVERNRELVLAEPAQRRLSAIGNDSLEAFIAGESNNTRA